MGNPKGGGGNQNTTQVQRAEPWAAQQPYIQRGFQQALGNLQSGGPQFYPNATYVPFSSQTEQALGGAQNRAQGSPLESGLQDWSLNTMQNPGGGQTQDYLQGLMGSDVAGQMPANAFGALNQAAGGQMLGENPFLDSQYDAAARRVTENFTDSVLPGINASFAGAGGSGSGIQREMALDASDVLGQNLSDMASNLYGNNFARERGLQMNAANFLSGDQLNRAGLNAQTGLGAAGTANNLLGTQGSIAQGAANLAPTAANIDWQNLDRLRGVGAEVEGMAGNVLQDSMNRFNYNQNLPESNLARYIAAIQGNYGNLSTTQNTVDNSGNWLSGALGGGMTGASIGGPWAALAGGVLGALSSR